jgi:hypothetical protein
MRNDKGHRRWCAGSLMTRTLLRQWHHSCRLKLETPDEFARKARHSFHLRPARQRQWSPLWRWRSDSISNLSRSTQCSSATVLTLSGLSKVGGDISDRSCFTATLPNSGSCRFWPRQRGCCKVERGLGLHEVASGLDGEAASARGRKKNRDARGATRAGSSRVDPGQRRGIQEKERKIASGWSHERLR